MARQARMADGTILSLPDGASDAAMDAAAADYAASKRQNRPAGTPRKQAVAPPKEKGWGDWLSQQGRAALEGIGGLGDMAGRIATSIPGIPATPEPIRKGIEDLAASGLAKTQDFVSGLFGIKGKPSNPEDYRASTAGTRAATKAADALKLSTPTTDTERLQSAVTRGAVQAAVPVLGWQGAVPQAIQVAGGAVAGGASEAAKQMGASEEAQQLAGLLAGVAVPAGVSGIRNVGSQATRHLKTSTKGATELAAEQLQKAAGSPEAAAAAATAIQQRGPWNAPQIPGVQPTLSEATLNPGIAALQRGRPSTAIQARQRANAAQRGQYGEQALGEGDTTAITSLVEQRNAAGKAELARRAAAGDKAAQALIAKQDAARATLEAKGGKALTRVEARNQAREQKAAAKAEAAITKRTERIGEAVSREQTTENIKPEFKARYQAIKDRVNAEFSKRILSRRVPVRMKEDHVADMEEAFLNRADAHYSDAGGTPSPEVQAITGELFEAAKSGNLNTRTIANINRRLAAASGRLRLAGENAEAAYVNGLRDIMNTHTDPFVSPAFKTQLAKANALRAEQGRIYEQGRIGPIMKDKPFGAPGVSDAELPSVLVASGPRGATLANENIAAFGKAKAEQLVREEMRRLADNGQITRNTLKSYNPLFEKFPNVRKDVDAMITQAEANKTGAAAQQAQSKAAIKAQEATNKAALEAQATQATQATAAQQAKTAASLAEQTALNKAFQRSRLGKAGDDPIASVHGLLNARGSKGFKDLHAAIKASSDTEALNGLRKAVSEFIKNKSTEGQGVALDAAGKPIPATKAHLDAIDSVLERSGDLLTPDQRTVLTTIRKELAAEQYGKTAGVYQDVRTDVTVPYATGRVQKLVNWWQKHATNKEAVDAIIEEAILKPQTAADLLARKTPSRLNRFGRTVQRAAVGATLGAQ